MERPNDQVRPRYETTRAREIARNNHQMAELAEKDMAAQRLRNRKFAGLPTPRLEAVPDPKPQETFWDSWGNDVRHNPTGKTENVPYWDGRYGTDVDPTKNLKYREENLATPSYENLLQ